MILGVVFTLRFWSLFCWPQAHFISYQENLFLAGHCPDSSTHASPTPSLVPGSGKRERIAFPSLWAGSQKNSGISPKCWVTYPLFCSEDGSSWSSSWAIWGRAELPWEQHGGGGQALRGGPGYRGPTPRTPSRRWAGRRSWHTRPEAQWRGFWGCFHD